MSIAVSDAYLVAIGDTSEQTSFWGEFQFIPPGSREGLSLSHSGFGRWGDRLSQLNNRTYPKPEDPFVMGAKWGSLELNRSALGGGWRYVNPEKQQQTGEWSMAQSGDDGVFPAPQPFIEMALDKEYDLVGVQIFFDDRGEEWATDVRVAYYDGSHAPLGEKLLLNEEGAICPLDYQQSGVKYVRITFVRWNLPRRFAKVSQVIPGQIRYFKDETMYSFLLRESISPFDSLKVPEFSIVFPNEKQIYNIINPTGVISKLREMMEISTLIGLVTSAGIEFVSTGSFFLFSWPDSADDETAAFYCRPDIAFANKSYVSLPDANTVALAAEEIARQSGTEKPFFVDASLGDVPVGDGGEQTISLQAALSQLAIVSGGFVKFERDGSYSLLPLSYGPAVCSISYDNMWGKPGIKQEPMVSEVVVNYIGPLYDLLGYQTGTGWTKATVKVPSAAGRRIEISSGFFASEQEARRIGQIVLDYYSNRLRYEISFRGDMRIEAGDVIAVETDFGFKRVFVLEHEIRYDGSDFLQGKVRGIGIDA